MFIRFLTVLYSFTVYYSFCQALSIPKEPKLSCKIKDETEKEFQDIPGVISRTTVRSEKVFVIVDVTEETEGKVFFRACEFPVPYGVHSKECQQLTVAYDNNIYPSQNITEKGQHLISLHLPDHLHSNLYVLEVRFMQDFKNVVGDNNSFLMCGVFATGSHRTKRQAESCQGTGEYIMLPGIDQWCRLNCAVGYCPSTHCTCANQAWPAEEEEDYYNEGDLNVEFLNR